MGYKKYISDRISVSGFSIRYKFPMYRVVQESVNLLVKCSLLLTEIKKLLEMRSSMFSEQRMTLLCHCINFLAVLNRNILTNMRDSLDH
jgi:hypothetical protein